jgi:hypothetical protein
VPGLIPVTLPFVACTVTVASGLLHVPPAGVLVSVIIDPTHTLDAPVITDGELLTVTANVATALVHALDTV